MTDFLCSRGRPITDEDLAAVDEFRQFLRDRATTTPTEKEQHMSEAIKVTVTDPESGEVLGEQLVDNDYIIVAAGTCHVAHTNAHANGTHVLTVKGRQA